MNKFSEGLKLPKWHVTHLMWTLNIDFESLKFINSHYSQTKYIYAGVYKQVITDKHFLLIQGKDSPTCVGQILIFQDWCGLREAARSSHGGIKTQDKSLIRKFPFTWSKSSVFSCTTSSWSLFCQLKKNRFIPLFPNIFGCCVFSTFQLYVLLTR